MFEIELFQGRIARETLQALAASLEARALAGFDSPMPSCGRSKTPISVPYHPWLG